MLILQRLILLVTVTLFPALPTHASAQTATPLTTPATAQELLKGEEVDQLVAPIALFPDPLLANVLMASTYPLEVVHADRWATANKNLKGKQLKAAAEKQTWENSVKQLTATPSVLYMMSSQLEWTQKLGDAVLAQEADVMDAVQRLRGKADAQNTLKTTKEQKVTKRTDQGKQVIVIEQTDTNTMYVPHYDPAVVYGAWPYPAYPPYSYPPYGGYLAGGLIGFGTGVALAAWGSNSWGGGFGWGNNNINIDRGDINIGSGNRWTHHPEHRHGVRYNNSNVAQKFGKADIRAGAQDRMDFRGRSGQEVLKPGGDRGGVGDRDRPRGDRAGSGDRQGGERAADRRGGDRAGARDRQGGSRQNLASREGGDRRGAGNRGPQQRPTSVRPGRDNALTNLNHGRSAMAHANRGRESLGGMPGGMRMGDMPGGGFRGGGMVGGFRGGGGRRSDIALKENITLLGHVNNGVGFYRFVYRGSEEAYVGVMAQEVQAVRPDVVLRGRDGYLRVLYGRLGLKFETFERWIASGAHIPVLIDGRH